MAILTTDDFIFIRQFIQQSPYRDDFKAWGLSKQAWMDTFQAAEDWFVNGFDTTPTVSFKAAIEAEAGPMTNQQAKAIGSIWMHWRFDK